MSTQMAVLTGSSSISMAQTKPGVGKSAPVFGAEMQHALASAAAGTALPQDGAAAGHVVVLPEAGMGEGQLEGFASVNDLQATLGAASSAVAGQPAMPGVQSFLPGTMIDGPMPEAAQAASGTQAAAEARASASSGPGSPTPGTVTGVPVLAAAATAAAAVEPESPTAALSTPRAQQGAAPGGHSGSGHAASGAAGISAPAAGVSAPAAAATHAIGATATGMTAAQAQKGSFGAQGAAPNGPVGDAQPGVSPAQLFAVAAGQQPPAAAGQQPPAAAPAQPAPAALPAPAASPPLNAQLQGPLFSLASAKPGEHTMTLSVTPDNLGPVTVRAQIGAEGVRVELFAPTDAGREALRSILQDLKRDLASAGLGADLDLSSQSQPDEPWEDGPDRHGNAANQDGTPGRQLRGPGHHAGPYLRLSGSETGLDVLA